MQPGGCINVSRVQTLGCRKRNREQRRSLVDHTATDIDPLDRIDRSIEIDAPAERVWDLVTRPGWWINEGAVDPEPDVHVDGSLTVLTHPKYGEFQLET